jgi:hypothetical protein
MGNISGARTYYNKSLSLTPKELLIYEKSTYAIRVQYPCDWSVAGTNGSTSTFVRFFSPAFNVATVTFGTETLPKNSTTLGNYTHLIIDSEKTFPAFKMLGLKTNSTVRRQICMHINRYISRSFIGFTKANGGSNDNWR